MKTLHLQYFAILREQRGLNNESMQTNASTPAQLYEELKCKYQFSLESEQLRAAVNGEFTSMDKSLSDEDEVVYIPPVAGG